MLYEFPLPLALPGHNPSLEGDISSKGGQSQRLAIFVYGMANCETARGPIVTQKKTTGSVGTDRSITRRQVISQPAGVSSLVPPMSGISRTPPGGGMTNKRKPSRVEMRHARRGYLNISYSLGRESIEPKELLFRAGDSGSLHSGRCTEGWLGKKRHSGHKPAGCLVRSATCRSERGPYRRTGC
jgi:hypothetical protein